MDQSGNPVTYDKHDESGQFTPTYTAADFIEALGELDAPTTGEVAEFVGCAHRTALHHLNQLEEAGDISSRQAGRAKVWTLTDGGRPGEDETADLGLVRSYLERALDELPENVPGRTAVEDALAVLPPGEDS